MQVEVVSPERITYSGEAEMVIVRTVGGGELAFLSGHVPFIGVLQVSAARVIDGGETTAFALHQGFVQMANEKVTILSDVSEAKDEIDISRAEAARSRAEAAIAADADDEDAQSSLERALIRLSVATGEAVGV
ncbi:MAG: ATP synthase F1 subunit epsilon [Acidimicrobiales bacterium]